MTQKTDTLTLNKPKASAADLSQQVHPLCITAKLRTKVIVHLENRTCRKLSPYHQDPDVFLINHSKVKNIFIYFKKTVFSKYQSSFSMSNNFDFNLF